MSEAAELHQRGVAATNAGRYAEARRLLTRAERLSEDEDIAAQVESSLAHLEAETGDSLGSLRRCDLLLERPRLSPRTRARVRSQRAMLLMITGRISEALEDFSVVIAALTDVPDLLGKALLNRGNVFLQLHDVTRAEADFRASIPHSQLADSVVDAAMAQHNLGYCRYLAGDLVAALRLMDRAAVVLAPLSAVSAATCQQDRAEVLMAAGLVDDGREALREAARAYGSRRLRRQQAEAELALARASVNRAPAEAVVAARAAARHFRTAQVPALAVRADGVGAAAALRRGDHTRRLVQRAAAVETELAAQGQRWEARAVGLSCIEALVFRGELAEAGDRLARTRLGDGAPLGVRLLDREVRAAYAAARGRRADALAHLRAGLADLHAWQSSFGSLDLQTMVVGHGRRLGAAALALAVESPRVDVLFEWSERARMLASRIQPVAAPEDTETLADLAELRAGPSPAREAELRRRIRERAWARPGSGEVTDPVGLAEVQAALGEEHALVAYVASATRLVALVVTDRGAERHDLGERSVVDGLLGGLLPDLDVAATDLPEPIRSMVRGELVDRLRRLDEVLVAPLADAVGERRLVLTPSGVLAGVPWPLLPGWSGRPVEVARSATAWLAGRASPVVPGGLRRAGFVAGPRVPRASAEVRAAAERWPDAVVLDGARATAAAVSELAAGVDVLHIAAHGRHTGDNPLFSGVELADGAWYGYDIDRLPAVPQVVLLSACEVGRSTVRHGEELIGMATAWLHAGARLVVASPSAVDDAAAHDALLAVHTGLRSGLDPAAALAGALGSVSEDAAPAPFVCFS